MSDILDEKLVEQLSTSGPKEWLVTWNKVDAFIYMVERSREYAERWNTQTRSEHGYI